MTKFLSLGTASVQLLPLARAHLSVYIMPHLFLGPSIAPLSLDLTNTLTHPQQASQLILVSIVDTAILVDLTPLLDSNTRLHIPGKNDFHLAISPITPSLRKEY